MNEKIQIYKKNESIITIQCSNIISEELSRYFSAKISNARFHPLCKQGLWDGRIKYFNSSSNELSIGLIESVYEFAKKGSYDVECMFDRFDKLEKSDLFKFINILNLPFEPRDYQIEAAYQALLKKHLCVHSSTASGKSLIIYIITRFLALQNKKILLIFPNVQLVTQMFSDFESYGWNAEAHCHKIYAGQKKIFNSPVSLSTWQSLSTIKDKSILESFSCIITDEAQFSKAPILSKICKQCVNAEYRFGFSGTYPEKHTADWFSIVGCLGPIQTFATYKSLQENGHIAQIKIFTVKLNYDKNFKIKVYQDGQKDYAKENDLIYQNEERTAFLCKLVQNMKENVLVLFQKREKHGHLLKDYFEKNLEDKNILYIDGTIDILDREEYRKVMEESNNVVLLATYATLSTGCNIKNLPNIVFASSYKSKIKILQSIGRSLRLHPQKVCAKLYDVVDDLSFKTSNTRFINYSLLHSKERMKYYQEQNWSCKEINFEISR